MTVPRVRIPPVPPLNINGLSFKKLPKTVIIDVDIVSATASVRKHKKSVSWYACITGPDCKQKQCSTGLAGKAGALAATVAAERALKKLVTVPHQLRQALDRPVADYARRGCYPAQQPNFKNNGLKQKARRPETSWPRVKACKTFHDAATKN